MKPPCEHLHNEGESTCGWCEADPEWDAQIANTLRWYEVMDDA